MDIRVEKINELIKDESFGEEIKNAETVEDFQSAFKAHGVDLTIEEAEAVCARIAIETGNADGISEDYLEKVSGGGAVAAVAGGVIIAGACYGVGYAAGRVFRWAFGR